MARPRRILLAQTSFLGDVILTTPLARVLREGFPESEIWWLVRPDAVSLIAPLAGQGRVMAFAKRGADAGVAGTWALSRRLRALRFDVAIGVQRSVRTALLLALAGIPVRIGFAGSAGAWLYHHRVPRRGVLARDRLLALASPLGLPTEPAPSPELAVDPGAARAIDEQLGAAGVTAAERLGVVAPGSAWATKRWPVAHFAEAARRLIPARVDRVVVVGGLADADLAAVIAAALPPGSVLDLTGKTDLSGMVAVVARATVVLANDSAPAHAAAALGVPVVAVFGPTVPEQGFAPIGPAVRVVGRALACRPCSRHGGQVCPIGTHECMRDLPPDVVVDAAADLLVDAGAGKEATRDRSGADRAERA